MNTELDLRQIFFILKQRLWLLIAATILFGGAAYGVSKYVITPKYSATASMYVYNEKSRTEDITTTDLTTSQKLVQTYIVILTSNSVLNGVSDKLDGEYTAAQIREMISATAINDTEAFKVTVTNEDPKVAQKIANTIANVAPAEIIRVVKAGSVEVIDYATLPDSPSSPHVMRNSALGAIIGLVLAVLLAIIKAMLDTAVRTEEELSATFTIPVIGVIPPMNGSGNSGRY